MPDTMTWQARDRRLSRVQVFRVGKLTMPRIPMIMVTIINSIRVNPFEPDARTGIGSGVLTDKRKPRY